VEQANHIFGRAAWRRLAVVFALAAVLVRAVVPVGWMPSTQLSSGVPIVICTVSGEQHILLDADGHPIPGGEKHDANRGQAPCAFAAVASLGAPSLSSFPVPILVEVGKVHFVHDAARVHRAIRTSWQSRAPPRVASTV